MNNLISISLDIIWYDGVMAAALRLRRSIRKGVWVQVPLVLPSFPILL